ncbi:MAG TPA: MauE/DoxX family redox-associated membrane protein [Myxococcota bacterium]|nr:MauE/DoxX family redox-associated membrane protein [Myxococcota bacterium]
MSVSLDPALSAVLRASLALLFGVAAAHKLRAPRAFASVLAEYRLLPAAASLPLGIALAAAELALALALCAPAFAREAALAAALLLALYGVAIATPLARGIDLEDCGCGFGARPLGAGLLLRNALLVAAALAAALPTSARALGATDVLTIVAGTASAALVFAAADGLAARRARAA